MEQVDMISDQERKALKQVIRSNQHEVFVISVDEMDSIIKSSPKGKLTQIQTPWQKLKNKAELGANYYASADDLRTLSKLVGDLGGFATKAYVKTYSGKPHIILKGHPGLRKVLTGTKYGIKNPKVVTMGLGKSGAIHAAKSGGILSVVLLSVYRVIDYFLTDEATLNQLIGSLATDIVKIGITAGASIAAASAVVGLGVAIAVGPIIAVIAVGVVTSMALGEIDKYYGITDRVITGIDNFNDGFQSDIQIIKSNLMDKANEAAALVIDYVVDSTKAIVIDTAKHQLRRFSPIQPRVF